MRNLDPRTTVLSMLIAVGMFAAVMAVLTAYAS
jgi:hypothetical protein